MPIVIREVAVPVPCELQKPPRAHDPQEYVSEDRKRVSWCCGVCGTRLVPEGAKGGAPFAVVFDKRHRDGGYDEPAPHLVRVVEPSPALGDGRASGAKAVAAKGASAFGDSRQGGAESVAAAPGSRLGDGRAKR